MTRLKFLILALGLMAVCGVQAVQLPTTSSSAYTPVTGESAGEFESPFGTMYVGSYHAVGDYSSCAPGAITGYTTSGETCESCCKEQAPDEDERAACISFCYDEDPPLSPIDGGWWFLIVLAVLGAAFSVTLRKKLV